MGLTQNLRLIILKINSVVGFRSAASLLEGLHQEEIGNATVPYPSGSGMGGSSLCEVRLDRQHEDLLWKREYEHGVGVTTAPCLSGMGR